ncbi:MAG: DNA recombination protein RmuC [Lachnospiraceae bacterium]|nr:DNA recombination protein RmuC [Lachnospiraceae bacterium]
MEYIIIAGIVIIIILQIILIVRSSGGHSQKMISDLSEQNKENYGRLSGEIGSMDKQLGRVSDNIHQFQQEIGKTVFDGFREISDNNVKSNQVVVEHLQKGLNQIQDSTERRLDTIQKDVNRKLDVSLNQRLDESFDKVTQQLTQLYKSLGELGSMSDGIQSLNKTLSNVKTRGTWGEIQLENILKETMQEGQYEKNVKLSMRSEDAVEFVIKIPSKEDDKEFLYLPIDSKFPTDRYIAVVDAANSGDQEMLAKAVSDLGGRIKAEAMKIRNKYILPPKTTDFAIMFLPTEAMYAEVLRINGLAELCQNQYHVIISGPMTITALLNSLRLGFANLALNKKTNEVRKILQAVKAQYSKLDDLIDITQKRIELAAKSTDELKNRTGQIQKKMSKIDDLPSMEEADRILQLDTDDGNEDVSD